MDINLLEQEHRVMALEKEWMLSEGLGSRTLIELKLLIQRPIFAGVPRSFFQAVGGNKCCFSISMCS